MPVQVIHGKQPGPRLFVSAAIHGDEINGIEIIRRLLKLEALDYLRGTLIAVPIVNVHGFLARSRYLPDRRDLNRVFPGSKKGSLAARLAQLFMREVVSNCTHGIDLHTGALHRSNLPQVRADLTDPETRRLAQVFGVPVLIQASLRDGSLRQAAAERGVISLLYEAGEALRFDEPAIRTGFWGVVAMMQALGMIEGIGLPPKPAETLLAQSTRWVRAPKSGVLGAPTVLGARVCKGSTLGIITDPFGESEVPIITPINGIIIGRVNLPLVNEGEALFHIARLGKAQPAHTSVDPLSTGVAEPAVSDGL
jgi:predicted deacylase